MNFLQETLGGLFNNTLRPWQWAVLAAVPPLVVLLYCLKLKRQPLEVPSTYLWSRTIEDLHVNSIWQRLRHNLLLFLQLLLLALVMLVCLRPGWRGTTLTGSRFVFLIDRSASMSATDAAPTRLDAAKAQALALIDQMKGGDVAMVISFSDKASVEQEFTSNRRLLRDRVQRISPSARTTDLREALRAAAGLANVGRSSDPTSKEDEQVAQALPATVYLLTDGGFPAVAGFDLGNLSAEYLKIGTEQPDNVGIVAFTTERNVEKPEQVQAFGQIENYGTTDVKTDATLYRDGELADAQKVTIPAGSSAGVKFDLRDATEGTLRIELSVRDALALDNVASAAINPLRAARVLYVTRGNESLRRALETPNAKQIARVVTVDPSVLATKEHQDQAATGEFDLIIYDRCKPEKMPQCNTLFLAELPPVEGWSVGDKVVAPQVIDVDRAHPLVQMPDMGPVRIAEAVPVKGPAGATTLIYSHLGDLLVIAPRQSYEDCVLGFGIVGTNEKGELYANTDWPHWFSFPIFCQNILTYLGGGGRNEAAASLKPGQTVSLRPQSPVDRLKITTPAKQSITVQREGLTTFQFAGTDELGIYEVREGDSTDVAQRFAVNLHDSRETDLRPATAVPLGHTDVKASVGTQTTRRELWKLLLIAGLLLLVFEWYVYNKRVYF